MNYRKGLVKKIHMSPESFWHTKQFCYIFTPADQLLCTILHKNGPTTYNERFTACNIMALVKNKSRCDRSVRVLELSPRDA